MRQSVDTDDAYVTSAVAGGHEKLLYSEKIWRVPASERSLSDNVIWDALPYTMNPSVKDSAEFLRILYQMRRINRSVIVRWVDQVIHELDVAPTWAIDLSLSREKQRGELLALLSNVPGKTSGDLPRLLAAAKARDDWIGGELSDEELIDAWFFLYPEIPKATHLKTPSTIWQYLDEVFETLLDERRPESELAEARRHLLTLLAPLKNYSRLAREICRTPQ